jgi:hypothetical protein
MEENVRGIVTKVSTTKDQCVRVQIDVDKAFAQGVNLIAWQDEMVNLKLTEEMNDGK